MLFHPQELGRLQPNPDWAKLPIFDRHGWQRLPFGAFADSINERVEPTNAAEEIYVGLDDLDSGSLHIRRWGKGSDVIGTKLRFRKGDLIFGRRRAYQRKLVVAEMDGICSAHAMVARAKPEVVLPEFLPFLMMSDKFMNRAVEISVGSLSPTINWTTLKLQEFDLPPLDQQRRIAEILWTVNEVVERWKASVAQHATSLHAYASSLTFSGLKPSKIQDSPIGQISADWQCVRLEEVIVTSAYGPRFPGSRYSPDGNVRTLRTTDFDRIGGISFSDVPAAKLEAETIALHKLIDGDFLLSRSGEYAGLTAMFNDPNNGETYIPGAFLIRFRFNERLTPEYLLALCCSGFGDKFVKLLATGSAQPNISGSAFARLRIPLPPIEEQCRIVEAISMLRISGIEMITHQQRSAVLFASLINSLC